MAPTTHARLTSLPVAVLHLLLVVLFIAGVVVIYTHPEPRDADVRKVGMLLATVSAALIFVRLGVGEFMAVLAARDREQGADEEA